MGDTWTIKVISESMGEPTELSIIDRSTGGDFNVSPKIKQVSEEDYSISDTKLMGIMGTVATVAVKGASSYLSFTGQNAKSNKLKRAVKYTVAITVGALATVVTGGGALAFGIGGALGAGAIATQEQISYKVQRTEEEAYSEYLKKQSATSIDNSKGNYYKWKIF